MKDNKTILVVAAHPDDEVLGCGGSIARFAKEGHEVHILIMADGESSRVSDISLIAPELLDARNESAKRACKVLGCSSVTVLNLPDNRLDGLERLDIVKLIEVFIDKYLPSTVFTHYGGDVNIDHRIVHDAVITACRPQPNCPVKELLFFEIPSSTEWRPQSSVECFFPNYFVDISSTLSVKIEALRAYESELRVFPHPRSIKAIEALIRWRGATVGVNAAEGFIIGRIIV
ncbi:PIG-L family deacetylase [Methanospirillum sp. J.3.6.1-F.2.7.3]|uniref:PIG-L family deacetylase n=1 Tax=Methanospirillum purgamenti TaxID=2834276 RepID=A0A8E7B1N8_9EURY|nr:MULTISPECIES: PIG-L deacetylase family protein [Methanospirillum]MDX8549489.1 PIG-L deacetylase family protein [Methanospirillum hungatei]QVV89229.1 PIG-L family deacetylase [Methanospirillum sp. J.3.6.1-F.2.7.3]